MLSFNVTKLGISKYEGNKMLNFLTWESRDSKQMLKVKYTPTVTANL